MSASSPTNTVCYVSQIAANARLVLAMKISVWKQLLVIMLRSIFLLRMQKGRCNTKQAVLG